MTDFDIRPVADGGGATLADFIEVPWSVFRDDPQWIPPLKIERRDALSPKAPFFEHARWQGFVGFADGKPVARISAQIDDLYEQRHGEPVGYFGMLDAPDDQGWFDALVERAALWLRERGRTRMVGPFNLGINQDLGVLVDGFDTPPFMMMPHSLPYYGARVEGAGLTPATDLLAYMLKPAYEVPPLQRTIEKRYLQGVTVEPVDRKNLGDELEIMRDIFNDAWSGNWGFTPFTKNEFQAIGKEIAMITPRDFLKIARLDGRPVAFVTLLPNLNEAIRDLNGRLLPFGWAKLLWRLKVKKPRTGRVALMGVRREFHNTRLGPGLAFAVIHALRQPAIDHGLQDVELSWILEDNAGMRGIIESIGGTVSKRYRMYERELRS
ncbi:MAG: N-acetyltransferase [Pseudomonadota bacterium]